MISLTRLNGERFAVNPDLLEHAEETPDTVITCTNGTRFVVAEPIDEVIARVQAFRASVLAQAHRLCEEHEDGAVHLELLQGAADSSEPDDHRAP